MAKTERYKTEQVAQALHEAKGMITIAAQKLRCNPETVRNYIKRHASVAQACQDERDMMTDIAELALYRAIQNGEPWSVSLYLRTIGRHRGYVEKQELTHSGTITLTPERAAQLSDAELDDELKRRGLLTE